MPPDSSGSSVPQIAGYDLEQSHSPTNKQTEMAFSSCSPLNRIKVFHEHEKNKTTQAEVRILLGLVSRGGREVLADIPIRTLSLHSVTPSEKS